MPTLTLLLALTAFFLVLLNGAFVAAEFAIVKLRSTQADEMADLHGVRGRVLQTVHGQLDAYLSACQLGITLASLGLGWIGEPAFARLLEPLLRIAGVEDSKIVAGISFAVAFTLISFLHIVLGELAPKTIALRRPEAVSLATAVPLYLFYWAMFPFIFVLNAAANSVVRSVGVTLAAEGDTVHSREELRSVLKASHRHGEFGAMEARVLDRGLELGELVVGDLMQPLSRLATLSLDQTIEEVLMEVRTTRFSRYPVRDPATATFAGLLIIKDLITAVGRLQDIEDLRPYLRPLPQIAESESVPKLLGKFRQGSPHFAMVADPRDTVLGFVTFENVVEAFLGPVDDEFKKESRRWQRHADGSFTGPANLSLLSLEDAMGITMPEVDANSVGGLVIEKLGRIPHLGERIEFEGFEIEILAVEGHRVERVCIRAVIDELMGG